MTCFKFLILALGFLLTFSWPKAQDNNSSFPDDLEVITAKNANRLEELTYLGLGNVNKLIWSPDNQYIVAVGASGAWLFNSNNLGESIHIQAHTKTVTQAAFSTDSSLMATSSRDKVIVSQVETGQSLYSLDTANGFVAFSPDGKWLVTDSPSGDISPKIWSVGTGELIADLKRNDHALLRDIAFSQDGGQMVADYESHRWPYMNAIKLWNTVTWEERLQIQTGIGVQAISFAANDSEIIGCSKDVPLAWRLDDGQSAHPLPQDVQCEHEDVGQSKAESLFGIALDEVFGEVVASDASKLAFINADGFLEIREADMQQRQISTFAFSNGINDLTFSPDGRHLAALETNYGGQTVVRLWDLERHPISTASIIVLDDQNASSSQLTFLSNDQLLIYDNHSGRIRIWDAESAAFVSDYRLEVAEPSILAVNPESTEITSVDWLWRENDTPQLQIRVWEISSGKMTAEYLNPGSYEQMPVVRDASYMPITSILATAGWGVHLWDSLTGQEIAVLYDYTFIEGQWEIAEILFSPDGRFLVADTIGRNGQIYVWNVERTVETYADTLEDRLTNTGSLITQLSHVSSSLIFSPDGKLLVSGAHGDFWGGDNTIKVWNTATWEEIAVLAGHVEGVSAVDFAPHGRLLASAGFDGTIRLWGV